MPLEPYRRGKVWWAKGRVEYCGRPISRYYRESTRSSTEQGAWQWCEERTQEEVRRHLLGDEVGPLPFAEAVLLYDPDPQTAKYLDRVLGELGAEDVNKITTKQVKELCRKILPNASTDTWRRWIIVPIRAVINNAAELGLCKEIKISGFSTKERVEQDKRRGKKSRPEKRPGSWEWLMAFKEAAPHHLGTMAHLMFVTGTRVGQATEMTPEHLRLDEGKVVIPGAKGHDDRIVQIPPELVDELRQLRARAPRGWEQCPENLRVFGYASKDGPRKAWATACRKAGIQMLTRHEAGRHGFGQEMCVRQGVDYKSVAEIGGWADTQMLHRTYTHAEDSAEKVLSALRTGRVQAAAKESSSG